jgi:hypothetical protein
MSVGYIRHRVVIAGQSLLMHSGQLADPLNAYAKALKEVSKKRGKTDEDHSRLADLEFEGSLYLDSKKRVVLPSMVLEAHICEAARKSKAGKTALAGLFVDGDAVLEYAGGPLTLKALVASKDHRLVAGVRVQQSRVMRTRPLFTNWSATFEVSLLSTAANSEELRRWLDDGGAMVGLCDYRPRHGRYEVRKFEVIKEPAKKAA